MKINFIEGGVTAPPGFKAGGIKAGLKKGNRLDLALLMADRPCQTAGVFTTNTVKAHPVVDAMEKLHTHNPIQAILVNSDSANACTGPGGWQDLKEILLRLSEETGINEENMIMASTGVIGQRVPVQKIIAVLPEMISYIAVEGHGKAAQAIMTTDTRPKECALRLETAKGPITFGAMAKGAGMINPNMATMLAFITTDARIEDRSILQKALSSAVDKTLNRLDLDGDTSTNDTVIAMASGSSGIDPLQFSDVAFDDALESVCCRLAEMIAADFEGGTKIIKIFVKRAVSNEDAEKAARTVAESSLVKTAFFGEDANWGRIMAALGRSGAHFNQDRVSMDLNDLPLVREGRKGPGWGEKEARKVLSEDKLLLSIDLGEGEGKYNLLTGDLSTGYVEINASYRS